MVQIIEYSTHQNAEGKQFVSLTIQGEVVMKQSAQGKFYATARKCNIACTFDEATAAGLIGQQMPGSIEKVQCDAYEATNKETGEVKTLTERYEYVPEQSVPALRIAYSSKAA